MEGLRKCRHCGGEAQLHTAYDGSYQIQCIKCGIGTLHEYDAQRCIDTWNACPPTMRCLGPTVEGEYASRCDACEHSECSSFEEPCLSCIDIVCILHHLEDIDSDPIVPQCDKCHWTPRKEPNQYGEEQEEKICSGKCCAV